MILNPPPARPACRRRHPHSLSVRSRHHRWWSRPCCGPHSSGHSPIVIHVVAVERLLRVLWYGRCGLASGRRLARCSLSSRKKLNKLVKMCEKDKKKKIRRPWDTTPEPWALWWLLFPPHPSFQPFIVAAPWFRSHGWCCRRSPLSCVVVVVIVVAGIVIRGGGAIVIVDVVAAAAGRRHCGLQSLRGGEQRMCDNVMLAGNRERSLD